MSPAPRLTVRNNAPANYAASFDNAPQNVDLDLGSTLTLSRLAFWNYPFANSAGVSTLQVFTSTDASFSSVFLAGTFNPTDNGNGDVNPDPGVRPGGLERARYVRLGMVTTYSGNDNIGFSEVAFEAVDGLQPVPEPASATLMCLGAVESVRLPGKAPDADWCQAHARTPRVPSAVVLFGVGAVGLAGFSGLRRRLMPVAA